MIKRAVNNKTHRIDVAPDTPLLWVLRDYISRPVPSSAAARRCGARTVHIDGEATRSCVTPVSSMQGQHLTTIEELPEKATISFDRVGCSSMFRSAIIASPVRSCSQ